MEIKVTTVHNKKRMIKYSDYFAGMRKPFLIFDLICTVVLLACDVFLIMLSALTFELILMTALVIFVDLLMVASFWVIPRIAIKKSHNTDAVLSYVFCDDGADFTAESMMIKESGSFKYPAIIKVCKNDTDVYLFISKRQAYIVDISELSEIETLAFKALVTAHLPARKVKWK